MRPAKGPKVEFPALVTPLTMSFLLRTQYCAPSNPPVKDAKSFVLMTSLSSLTPSMGWSGRVLPNWRV